MDARARSLRPRLDGRLRVVGRAAAALLVLVTVVAAEDDASSPPVRSVDCPWVDLTPRSDLRTIDGPGDHQVSSDSAGPLLEQGQLVIRVGPRGPLALQRSDDGGQTWRACVVPDVTAQFPGIEPADPCVLRASDGRMVLLCGDRSGRHGGVMLRGDEDGRTWSGPRELPATLAGLGHAAAHLPDGRLVIAMLDTHPSSPTRGDVVAWVGTFDELEAGREGEFTCRVLANATHSTPARHGLPSVGLDDAGRLVVIASWHRRRGETPVRASVRFAAADMIELVPTRAFDLPTVDLDGDADRQVVVDRVPGRYLGHVSTCLLEDGRTILCVYPEGHGRGAIIYKRSSDGGRTWSPRLPTPANWATSREVPTIHRVIDPRDGRRRLILWSGLHPARLAVSEDDGRRWSPLQPVGDWGGIVVMGFVERLRDGSYLAMFHDDGRFFTGADRRTEPPTFTLYKTFSRDGGLTWSFPEAVWSGSDVHLCEPGVVRSPDGTRLAVLLRENRRRRNSFVIFSSDEGQTWSPPRELPAALTGDRHTARFAPDGRLVISFRDTALESPTQGDWVGWVGTWDDLERGRPGAYRVRFKDNRHRWDTAYPGLEVLPDGTFVATTYGHWVDGAAPYILSVRFMLEELDRRLGLD